MTPSGGGVDPHTIKPPDAIAALRSFPRRWRSALAFVADDPSSSELVRNRAGESWSALEHATYTAELLKSTGERVQRARREDRPVLGDRLSRPPTPGGDQDDALDAALDAIAVHAPALADSLDGLPPDDWGRSAILSGREVTVLSLVQHAVADAAAHLRAAERALRTAKGER